MKRGGQLQQQSSSASAMTARKHGHAYMLQCTVLVVAWAGLNFCSPSFHELPRFFPIGDTMRSKTHRKSSHTFSHDGRRGPTPSHGAAGTTDAVRLRHPRRLRRHGPTVRHGGTRFGRLVRGLPALESASSPRCFFRR